MVFRKMYRSITFIVHHKNFMVKINWLKNCYGFFSKMEGQGFYLLANSNCTYLWHVVLHFNMCIQYIIITWGWLEYFLRYLSFLCVGKLSKSFLLWNSQLIVVNTLSCNTTVKVIPLIWLHLINHSFSITPSCTTFPGSSNHCLIILFSISLKYT
jgi:hypothetical protein